jgi:2-isopropylmalate synthase
LRYALAVCILQDMRPPAPQRLLIFDTTLRDGEQSPGCSMREDEKLRLAQQLARLGVDIIEAGFPISSHGDFRAVSRIAAEIEGPTIAALARAKDDDIDCAWRALRGAKRRRIHTFLATSDIHLACKLKITRAQALEQARNAVAHARSLCDDVEFSPEDATRSDPGFLCEVLLATVEAGATTLNIPDTVGYTTPAEFCEIINTIRTRVPAYVTISAHCHNDLGLAVANSLAAVAAGARQVECTINGIGERAGNAALEEIVMATRVRSDRFAVATNIRSEEICPTSALLASIIGFNVQPNKAIVGRNAFAHEAGIHQHGVINNPLCYEIMSPESVGATVERLVLGKHSGRHALALRFEQLGHSLTAAELARAYEGFIELADRKKTIYDQDLLALLPRVQAQVTASWTKQGIEHAI